jgi:hypothetical protein
MKVENFTFLFNQVTEENGGVENWQNDNIHIFDIKTKQYNSVFTVRFYMTHYRQEGIIRRVTNSITLFLYAMHL